MKFKIAIRYQALKSGEAQPMKKKGLVLRKIKKKGARPIGRKE